MSIPYAGLPPFQQRVADFVDAHDLRSSAEARVLDIVSEIGEVAKVALKSTKYGREPFAPGADWDDEVADLFFSVVCLANSTAVDLEKALDAALAKYAARIAEHGRAGSGR